MEFELNEGVFGVARRTNRVVAEAWARVVCALGLSNRQCCRYAGQWRPKAAAKLPVVS